MDLNIFQKEPALLVLAPVLVAAIVALILFAPLAPDVKAYAAAGLITVGLGVLRSRVTPTAKLDAAASTQADATPPPTVKP